MRSLTIAAAALAAGLVAAALAPSAHAAQARLFTP